jgi:hypothetical protein
VATIKEQIVAIPQVRRYGYGLLILVVLAYLIWAKWFQTAPLSPDAWVKPKPAVNAPKVAGPKVGVKKVPKKPVTIKFPDAPIRGDENGDGQDEEEWVDTVDIPPAPNGATALTKIDVNTGEVTNVIKAKPSPLFAFESTNYLGIGLEQHIDGQQKGKVYYKRDLARSKDVHFQMGVTGKASRPTNDNKLGLEGFAEANIELRF